MTAIHFIFYGYLAWTILTYFQLFPHVSGTPYFKAHPWGARTAAVMVSFSWPFTFTALIAYKLFIKPLINKGETHERPSKQHRTFRGSDFLVRKRKRDERGSFKKK